MKMMEGWEHQTYEERLRGDHINIHKYLKWGKEGGARLSLVVLSDRTRSSGHELKNKRFCLNIRKHFTVRVTEDWHRLPTEVVESTSFKIMWTWSSASCSRWLCLSSSVGTDDLQSSLPTRTILWFSDSVILWYLINWNQFCQSHL